MQALVHVFLSASTPHSALRTPRCSLFVRLSVAVLLGAMLVACGLDGVRGGVVAMEPDGRYQIRDIRGKDIVIQVDERTHKDDDIRVGDRIQAFIDKQRHAEFIERLD